MESMTVPLLSVIIPVYNAANYVERCIASVQKENIEQMEILCVDDGSTDESVAILERLAEQDKRIRVIRQRNQSAGAARNRGLSYAKGEFIHFLDADDWLCSGIYEKSIAHLQQHSADVCFFQYFSYDNATGQIEKRPCLLNRNNRKTSFRSEPAFFIYNMVAPWNKMYRRAWLEEHGLRFDEIVCGNDRGFYFRTLAAGGHFVLSKEYGVYYREQNDKSLTGASRYKHFDSLFYAWDTAMAAMREEKTQIRAMLLDCITKDCLSVFFRAPFEARKDLVKILGERFDQIDFSIMDATPVPYVWRRDVEMIRAGEHSCRPDGRILNRLIQLVAAYKIWGGRGCIVKMFGCL